MVASRGIPLSGDRGAWDTETYADIHAADIADTAITPRYHWTGTQLDAVYVRRDGTLALLGNWNAGAFSITLSESVIIDSDTASLQLGADQDVTLLSNGAGSLVITPAADTDLAVTFFGTTNSGVLTWMEDENYFQFADDVLLDLTLEVTGETLFSDKAKFTQVDGNEAIDSLNDGYMDYLATTGHRFNSAVAITGTGYINVNSATAFIVEQSGVFDNVLVVDTAAGRVGILEAAPDSALEIAGNLHVKDTTVNTTTTYYGLRVESIKTTGATTEADDFFGIHNRVELNQVGSTIGYLTGFYNEVVLTAGTVGDTPEDVEGIFTRVVLEGGDAAYGVVGSTAIADLNTGTIANNVYGRWTEIDAEAAMTSIGGSMYGHYIKVDADFNPTGNVYMLYLDELTGVDYGIYQNGNAPNILGGSIQSPAYLFPALGVLTLNTAVITVTNSSHTVAAEAGVADDLETISGGTAYQIVILQADAGDTITVKHGVGNVFLNGEADFELAGDKTLELFYDGVNWSDVGAGGGGGGSDSIIGPSWHADGTLAVLADIGEQWIMPSDGTIIEVIAVVGDNGSASSTIVDVHKNGTTIFTTQGNRPEIAHDDADNYDTGVPDVTTFDQYDIFTADIDQVGTDAKDLRIILVVAGTTAAAYGGAASDAVFQVEGALAVATSVDGSWIIPRNATILNVYITCKDPGSASSTIVDVNKNGVTIFTTQASRPELDWNDADGVAKSAAPDITSLAENDVLTIDIDQIGTDAADLTVIVAFNVSITDSDAIHDNVASEISAITEKVAPVAADMIIIEDSEAANVKKMVQIGNLPGGGGGGGNETFTDTFANEPAAGNDGDLFLPSDGFHIERDTGAAWVPWGPVFPMTKPPSTGWSWDNQDGASVDLTKGGIYIYKAADNADELTTYLRSTPATPYVITAALMPLSQNNNYNRYGITLRESGSGKLVIYSVQFNTASSGYKYAIFKFTNATTYGGGGYTIIGADIWGRLPLFWRIADDGTNRTFWQSDDGQNFSLYHTVGRTDYLTADQIGISCNPRNATVGFGVNVLSWKEE